MNKLEIIMMSILTVVVVSLIYALLSMRPIADKQLQKIPTATPTIDVEAMSKRMEKTLTRIEEMLKLIYTGVENGKQRNQN